MVNPEYVPSDNDSFSELVIGLQLALPVLPMDGQRMEIDSDAGERFRTDLLRIFSDCLFEPGVSLEAINKNVTLSHRTVNNVMHSFVEYVYSGQTSIRPGSQLSVTGSGFIVVAEEPEEEPVEIVCLDGSVNLFGTLKTVGWGKYPFLGEISQPVVAEDSFFAGESREGVLAFLNEVQLCSLEGYGELQGSFDTVVIPLPVTSLQIHKATPRA